MRMNSAVRCLLILLALVAVVVLGGCGNSDGDPAAGEEIFVANCAGCHVLSAPAGGYSQTSIGPNLDVLEPSYDLVVTQVTNGGGVMPPFKGSLSEQQIKDVAAYVSAAATG